MNRFLRPLGWILAIAVPLLTIAFLVNGLSNRIDDADRREAASYASFQRAQGAVDQLAKQVQALGAEPVVQPSQIPAAPAPVSPEIPVSTVRAAVSWYCSTGACDGRMPTLAQVVTGVSQYCANGACVGPVGKSGRDGKDGQLGPAPTSGQLAAAVAAFCGDGACKGDTGPAGRDGKDGSDGADGKDGQPGPVGPAGPPGPAGSVTPGDYACPSGEYVTSIHVGSDGSMSVACSPALPGGSAK